MRRTQREVPCVLFDAADASDATVKNARTEATSVLALRLLHSLRYVRCVALDGNQASLTRPIPLGRESDVLTDIGRGYW